jgi:hypothetical protein
MLTVMYLPHSRHWWVYEVHGVVYANSTLLSTSTTSGVHYKLQVVLVLQDNLNLGTVGAVGSGLITILSVILHSQHLVVLFTLILPDNILAHKDLGSINSTGYINTSGNILNTSNKRRTN